VTSPKKRPLSIWLLKVGFDATNSLVPTHGLQGPENATKLSEGASLFVSHSVANPPWWKDYFGLASDLRQSSVSAILFLQVSERVFAVTMGNCISQVRPEAYEYDFGLLVTLNCVDPEKLRNTDTSSPSTARQQRTQSAKLSDLNYFDFERDAHVLRSLTGLARPEYASIMRSVTGSAQVRFTSAAAASDLPELCGKLLDIYSKTDYRSNFPEIHNVRPIRDPKTLDSLNAALVNSLNTQDPNVGVAVPEILDFARARYFRLSGPKVGVSDLLEDFDTNVLFKYLLERNEEPLCLSADDLKRYRVAVLDEGENQTASFSLYRCLIYELFLSASAKHCHLIDGSWYSFDANYVSRVQNELAPLFSDPKLPASVGGHEEHYNLQMASALGGICLDKKNLSPKGMSQIEPCDVVTLHIDGGIVLNHVKMGTGSSELSHLFYQGQNSMTLLREDPNAVERLSDLFKRHGRDSNIYSRAVEAIPTGKWHVRYLIVTDKPLDGGLLNLPLFSQLSLARAARVLRGLGAFVNIGFVQDDRWPYRTKEKIRKKGREVEK